MEMTNDRERLLAKIKKLLNMAKHNASNETEAATALRQAEAMMRKHDIQFAEIEAKELNPSDMAMEGTGESRNSSWIWNLAWAASYLTSTMPTKRYSRESNAREIKFAGTKDDVQVALLMHDYLVGVTERLTKKYGGSRSENNAFKLGVAQTLVNRSTKSKSSAKKRSPRQAKAAPGETWLSSSPT